MSKTRLRPRQVKWPAPWHTVLSGTAERNLRAVSLWTMSPHHLAKWRELCLLEKDHVHNCLMDSNPGAKQTHWPLWESDKIFEPSFQKDVNMHISINWTPADKLSLKLQFSSGSMDCLPPRSHELGEAMGSEADKKDVWLTSFWSRGQDNRWGGLQQDDSVQVPQAC